jgi:uroporphyrin-III C-methyltransferase/precorrin-2 dehydrogenase/sirohydrochlorin ferrochelatase
VPFEIVPGVSALSAVPAAAGIPVTHRGLASQLTVVTGHDSGLDYAALARVPGTLVVFMGLANLEEIAAGLVAHGRAPDTPAAVVASGTTAEQREVIAPLGAIARAARGLGSPALVIVGDVVSLARELGRSARDTLALAS